MSQVSLLLCPDRRCSGTGHGDIAVSLTRVLDLSTLK